MLHYESTVFFNQYSPYWMSPIVEMNISVVIKKTI